MVEKAFTTGTVLKEISNSREANMEDLERKKKINPFAVKLKTTCDDLGLIEDCSLTMC